MIKGEFFPGALYMIQSAQLMLVALHMPSTNFLCISAPWDSLGLLEQHRDKALVLPTHAATLVPLADFACSVNLTQRCYA